MDLRKTDPYGGYEKFELELQLGRGDTADGGTLGDAHDRFLVRLLEISQSIDLLRHAVEIMPTGPFFAASSVSSGGTVPAGEAYSRIESSRGVLGCHLVSDGGSKPGRVQFRKLLHYIDGPRFPTDYSPVVARIISRAPSDFDQEVVISAGSSNGIRQDTPVVTGDGLVGRGAPRLRIPGTGRCVRRTHETRRQRGAAVRVLATDCSRSGDPYPPR